jgi:hypothetical protein
VICFTLFVFVCCVVFCTLVVVCLSCLHRRWFGSLVCTALPVACPSLIFFFSHFVLFAVVCLSCLHRWWFGSLVCTALPVACPCLILFFAQTVSLRWTSVSATCASAICALDALVLPVSSCVRVSSSSSGLSDGAIAGLSVIYGSV